VSGPLHVGPTHDHLHHLTYDEWNRKTGRAPKLESIAFPLLLYDQARQFRAPLFGSWRIWVASIFTGLLTGCVCAGIDKGMEALFRLRMYINDSVVESVGNDFGGLFLQYLAFCGVSVALAAVAGYLVCFQAPLAAGSGIPEIKVFLNGIVLPRVVSKITLIAKAVGILFSVAAGLPVGKEGPMIHSGAAVAGIISDIMVRWRNRVGRNQPLMLNVERRDMIAAGATAGVTAAFGAPLGGCLFAIEEGSSHMNPLILLKLFVAAAGSALMIRLVSSLNAAHAGGYDRAFVLGSEVPVFFSRFKAMEYAAWELPVFALMGAIGGLLGALFNWLNFHLTKVRQVWTPAPQYNDKDKIIVQKRDYMRFLEVLFVTFCITTLHFWIPMIVSCIHHGAGYEDPSPETSGKLAKAFESLPQTQKLFWETGTDGIQKLFHAEEDFDYLLLVIFCVVHFFTTCWTYGLGVPSGLFVPSLLCGAVWGRLIGQLMALGNISVAKPGIYAFIGAASFLAGAARITISLAMILMEVTGEAGFSLPIFTTVMVARWVGEAFNRGIYDMHIIDLKKIPLLEHEPEAEMLSINAHQAMSVGVVSFEEVESCQSIYTKLVHCTHHAFPVMRRGRMVGSISRDIVQYLLNNGDDYGSFDDHPKVVPRQPMWARLAMGKEALKPLAERISTKSLDLKPYLTKDFHTMSDKACMYGVYDVFRKLGLRHLWIISEDTGEVCGVITRKNLIIMEGENVSASEITSKTSKGPSEREVMVDEREYPHDNFSHDNFSNDNTNACNEVAFKDESGEGGIPGMGL